MPALSSAVRVFAIALGLVLPLDASAQEKITPATVLSYVEAANAQLATIIDASLLDVPPEASSALDDRRPRHVFQKARSVYERLQTIRYLNGLKRSAMPVIPGRDIKPSDVKVVVESILKDSNELAALYGLSENRAETIAGKKTPVDVYRSLMRMAQLINRLDLPPALPNDVYRVAETIVQVSRTLATHKGLDGLPDTAAISGSKTPADVYTRGKDILTVLRQAQEQGALAEIPSGVVTASAVTGKVTPGNVLDLLGLVLADLTAELVNEGVTRDIRFSDPVGGKTPTDVFERLSLAHAILSRFQS